MLMKVRIEVEVHELETMVLASPCQKFFAVLLDPVSLTHYLPTVIDACASGYLYDMWQVLCSSQALESRLGYQVDSVHHC